MGFVMKKIIIICACLFSFTGCDNKPPKICTDAIAKANLIIQNSESILERNKLDSKTILGIGDIKKELENFIQDPKRKKEDLVKVCKFVDEFLEQVLYVVNEF